MAIDRTSTSPDTGADNIEEEPPAERRPPPPDRPGTEGLPSRADGRRAATAAHNTDQQPSATRPEAAQPPPETPGERTPSRQESRREGARAATTADGSEGATEERSSTDAEGALSGENDEPVDAGTSSGQDAHDEPPIDSSDDDRDHPIDQSIRGGDEGSEPDVLEFTPEQLAELRDAEADIRDLAEEYGVSVDYTSRPIDPANARELNKAITRMAHEYPDAFRHVGNIKVLDSQGMAEHGSGARTLGHAIHEGQRPVGGSPIEPGIYLSQNRYCDKNKMDQTAAEDRTRGWNLSGTAEGTLYHEFGHVIDNQLRKNSAIRQDLARELKHAGISVDPDSLSWAVPPGKKPVEAGLSRYGGENPREMIAEGFSEWKLDQHPRPIARAIGTVIDKHFRER
jgi:hypothetical protein